MLVSSALLSGLAIALAAAAAAGGAPAWVVYVLAGVFTVASTPYVPAEGALKGDSYRLQGKDLGAAPVADPAEID